MVVLFITTFESPLFLQERIGKNRIPFTIIKLRTIKNGQVTFVGRILRKTGIDEIPQLINVVFGSMAIDVVDLYKTMNELITVTSSDITTPSQVMHGVRFNIQFKKEINEEEIRARLTAAPFVSTTVKFDSNVIFELGRRYGLQGRIYSHAIVVSNNILFEERGLKGWAFIPQEGNTLLSTMNAFLLQTKNKNASNIISRISSDLIEKIW